MVFSIYKKMAYYQAIMNALIIKTQLGLKIYPCN